MNRETDPIAAETVTGPIASDRRIGALDLARGFALLGILLVNVQVFNLSGLVSEGAKHALPSDGIVQWILSTFAENKFWTLFSLLFGMGFAVMLERAGSDRRGFIARYLRRTLALAAFGALHIVLIWSGDVLLNYAVAALVVLAILFCRPGWALVLGVAAAIAAAAAQMPRVGPGDVFVWWWYAAMAACYLRRSGRHTRAWFVATGVVGALLLALLAIYGCDTPADARKYASHALALLIVLPAAFDRAQWPARAARAGIWLFMVPVLASALAASLAQWTPASWWPPATPASEAQTAQRRAELRARGAAENKAMVESSYAESVAFRARNGFKRPGMTALMMGVLAGGLFLIGIGLVSSGAARSPERHMRLWRGLAWIGFPVGAVSVIGGDHLLEAASFSKPLAAWLSFLPETGALLMALGYLAFAFLLARRAATGGVLSWVAATGRMGLTNYLLQSVLATWFFYGYGLGFWGLGRTWQAVFVLAVFALQTIISRWWLSGHDYGPMEWLWRWITYARKPAMRVRIGTPSV